MFHASDDLKALIRDIQADQLEGLNQSLYDQYVLTVVNQNVRKPQEEGLYTMIKKAQTFGETPKINPEQIEYEKDRTFAIELDLSLFGYVSSCTKRQFSIVD